MTTTTKVLQRWEKEIVRQSDRETDKRPFIIHPLTVHSLFFVVSLHLFHHAHQKSVNKTSSILELDTKFIAQQLTAIDLVSAAAAADKGRRHAQS